jgi:predicted transposase/invertase (TIGR01784 family)
MTDKLSSQPHDSVFRESFSRVESAAAFLRAVLPPEVADVCRWERLRVLPGKFADDDLKSVESDLLYEVPLAGSESALCYVLFEHQSTPDPWMPLRLLIYMTRIWERWRKEHPKAHTLPAIIPMVLYQGAEGWTVAPRFADMLSLSAAQRVALGPYTPDFGYKLFDLGRSAPGDFPGPDELRLIVAIMKAVMQPISEMEKTIEGLLELMETIRRSGESRWSFRLALIYLYQAERRVPFDRIQTIINTTRHTELRSDAMTIAEELEARGREEGVSVGTRGAIRDYLDTRFGQGSSVVVAQALDSVSDVQVLKTLFREVINAAIRRAAAGTS